MHQPEHPGSGSIIRAPARPSGLRLGPRLSGHD